MGETNPEIAKLVSKMAYTTAKQLDPGGRLSEMDVLKGGVANIGFTPDGKLLDRAKYAASKDQIVTMLRRDQANLAQGVSKKLAKYHSAVVNPADSRIAWEPQRLTAPEVQPKNAIQHLQESGQIPLAPRPMTVQQYRQQLKDDESPSLKGAVVPPHDRQAVADFEAFAKGRSPAAIRQKASEVLAQFKADPWGDKPEISPAEENTAHIIKIVADDAAKKAEATLKRLEQSVQFLNSRRVMNGRPPMSKSEIARLAEERKLDVGHEVIEIWKRNK
jgi:hypothetical protein